MASRLPLDDVDPHSPAEQRIAQAQSDVLVTISAKICARDFWLLGQEAERLSLTRSKLVAAAVSQFLSPLYEARVTALKEPGTKKAALETVKGMANPFALLESGGKAPPAGQGGKT